VVSAAELEATGAPEAVLLAGALALEELALEEQAASAPPNEMTHRIPAADRVLSFIPGPSVG
jgi:hypothetical protein